MYRLCVIAVIVRISSFQTLEQTFADDLTRSMEQLREARLERRHDSLLADLARLLRHVTSSDGELASKPVQSLTCDYKRTVDQVSVLSCQV